MPKWDKFGKTVLTIVYDSETVIACSNYNILNLLFRASMKNQVWYAMCALYYISNIYLGMYKT